MISLNDALADVGSAMASRIDPSVYAAVAYHVTCSVHKVITNDFEYEEFMAEMVTEVMYHELEKFDAWV